jgi:hypothetical protein
MEFVPAIPTPFAAVAIPSSSVSELPLLVSAGSAAADDEAPSSCIAVDGAADPVAAECNDADPAAGVGDVASGATPRAEPVSSESVTTGAERSPWPALGCAIDFWLVVASSLPLFELWPLDEVGAAELSAAEAPSELVVVGAAGEAEEASTGPVAFSLLLPAGVAAKPSRESEPE